MLLLFLSCTDYDLGVHSDASAVDWFGAAEVQQLAAPDPFSLCDSWTPDLPSQVGFDESCVSQIETGPLEYQLEWRREPFQNYGEYSDVVMAPVVGQMTDDNGDGVIDSHDIPDVFVIADDPTRSDNNTGGVAHLLSGDSGLTHWSVQRAMLGESQVYPYRYTNAALGIVEEGGAPMIFTLAHLLGPPGDPGGGDPGGEDSDSGAGGGDDSGGPGGEDPHSIAGAPDLTWPCYPAAFSASGEAIWVQEAAGITCGGHAPVLADLNGDGDAELIVGAAVLSAKDGTILAHLEQGIARGLTYQEMGAIPAVADLDGDGQPEILAGSSVYRSDGSLRCTAGTADGFPGVADLDLDGQGEFLVVADGEIGVFEADCTQTARWPLVGGGHGGPPTIADFDADGVPEIGVAEAETYSVYESDGGLLWSMPVTDQSSHATGSAVYDFEGDGHPEVVYGDETTLWVFDGATGAVRMADTTHESRTLHELPTIADVDGDRRAEIIVANGGTHYKDHATGVYVLGGSAEHPWLGDRQVWNQHAYSIVNVADDLRIPAHPASNWPTHNSFRSGDLTPAGAGGSADAVALVDFCDLECDSDQISVVVLVGNMGAAPLRGRLAVSLYAIGAQGERTLLAQQLTSPDALAPQELSEPLRFRLNAVDVPLKDVEVVVDDAGGLGQVRECHEDNNVAQIRVECPE